MGATHERCSTPNCGMLHCLCTIAAVICLLGCGENASTIGEGKEYRKHREPVATVAPAGHNDSIDRAGGLPTNKISVADVPMFGQNIDHADPGWHRSRRDYFILDSSAERFGRCGEVAGRPRA